MDKVHKIEAEICWLHNKYELSNSSEAKYRREAYKELLEFIDSLPEEPVSEDLESEIQYLHKRYPEVSFAKLTRIVIHATRWQKQQMMKDALDCIIEYNTPSNPYLIAENSNIESYIKDLGFEVGDKVKLIIIKEAEK